MSCPASPAIVPSGQEPAMLGGYQRVPSGSSDFGDEHPPASPAMSSSDCSYNEKTPFEYSSLSRVSLKLRAYLRSRARWLYDHSRCLAGTSLGPVLPSFLRPRDSQGVSEQVNGIATLDGIRGFACFFVFNFHFLFTYTSTSYHGYGIDPTGQTARWIHQLPFIRLIFAGRAMVTVFFVLSGYVLSRKPLMASRSQSYDSMLQSLSSSIFRRGIRLFLPTVISTFMVFLALRAGWFIRATEIARDGVTLSFVEHHPIYFPTWRDQWWDYYRFVTTYIDFTNWNEWYNLYDPHVWTIPLEYRASMVLFVTLICLCRAKTAWRLLLLCSFIVFCGRWGRFELVLFLGGMLIAELDLITNTWPSSNRSSTDVLPTMESPPPKGRSYHFERSCLHGFFLVIGLYLLSFPDEFGDATPGFRTLTSYIPASYRYNVTYYRFWHSVGAVISLWAINNTPLLRRPFQTPLAQYLGKVSYAFYLVHGPILHSLGYIVMRWIFGVAGRYNEAIYEVSPGVVAVKVSESGKLGNHMFAFCLFLGWCVVLVVSIWAADIFYRVVDVPCVKFARWVENKVTGKG